MPNDSATSNEDFFTKQARLKAEAKLALAQVLIVWTLLSSSFYGTLHWPTRNIPVSVILHEPSAAIRLGAIRVSILAVGMCPPNEILWSK